MRLNDRPQKRDYRRRGVWIEVGERFMDCRYRFVFDNGEVALEVAQTRQDAIRKYSQEHGVPEVWVREHCKVRNEGLYIPVDFGWSKG